MSVPVKDPLLCPRCKVPMVPAAGFDGLWQCPNRTSHEFSEDPGQDRQETLLIAGVLPRPCPKCGAPCKRDDLGFYCDSSAHHGLYRVPEDTKRYWLAHLGLPGPLPSVRQAPNMGDGAILVSAGPIKKGHGAKKSGRRRKKAVKRKAGGSPDWRFQ